MKVNTFSWTSPSNVSNLLSNDALTDVNEPLISEAICDEPLITPSPSIIFFIPSSKWAEPVSIARTTLPTLPKRPLTTTQRET